MADDDEPKERPAFYTITPEATGQEKKCSTGFTGKAKAAYTNGDVFEGLYANGLRQGTGVYTYENRDVYEGKFQDNLKTGLGRVTYKKGGFYRGYFKDGKRDGEGTFEYANKDIYSGMWKDNMRHGAGTYVFANTKYEFKGDWKDGQILHGTWSLTDGSKYIGGFKHQKPSGDGIWQTAKGTIVEGAYVQQVVPIDGESQKAGAPPPVRTRIFWKTATLVGVED